MLRKKRKEKNIIEKHCINGQKEKSLIHKKVPVPLMELGWGAGHDILVHAAEGDGPCAGRLVSGRLICTWVVKLCLRLLATLFLFLFVARGYSLLGDGPVPSSQY